MTCNNIIVYRVINFQIELFAGKLVECQCCDLILFVSVIE